MTQPLEPTALPDLEATRRLLEQRGRVLDRIAARYEQLEEALEKLESLSLEYAPPRELPSVLPESARPRKPR